MSHAPALAVMLAFALASSSAKASTPGDTYRIQVVRVKVAPQHGSAAWDEQRADVAPKGGQSCCHGSTLGDGAAPDLRAVIRLGSQRFATRVVPDSFEATFADYAFFARGQAEPLTVEIWDHDDPTDTLIGSTVLSPDGEGAFPTRTAAFGEVLSLELSAVRVASAQSSFKVSATGEDVQVTPLYLLPGQRATVAASGKICVGKRPCGGPEGVSGRDAEAFSVSGDGTPGLLTVQLGEGELLAMHPFHPGLIVSSKSPSQLGFRLTTANGQRLVGSYDVEVRVSF